MLCVQYTRLPQGHHNYSSTEGNVKNVKVNDVHITLRFYLFFGPVRSTRRSCLGWNTCIWPTRKEFEVRVQKMSLGNRKKSQKHAYPFTRIEQPRFCEHTNYKLTQTVLAPPHSYQSIVRWTRPYSHPKTHPLWRVLISIYALRDTPTCPVHGSHRGAVICIYRSQDTPTFPPHVKATSEVL